MTIATPAVLLVGSGFHRDVLGEAPSPFCCWRTLLDMVAQDIGARGSTQRSLSPPLTWEMLVLAATQLSLVCASDGLAASQAEQKLRNRVARILGIHAAEPLQRWEQSKAFAAIKAFVVAGPCHLLDLNFDDVLPRLFKCEHARLPDGLFEGTQGRPEVRRADVTPLFGRWRSAEYAGLTLWKPHGHVGEPRTLRLGLRDYGLEPTLIRGAVDDYKAVEDDVFNPDGSRHQVERYLDGPCPPASRIADTWVTRVMELPCTMIGLSVSEVEWGLQWLVVQRARNYARRGTRPHLRSFRTSPSNALPGMDEIEFETWSAAWTALSGARNSVETSNWYEPSR